MFPVRVLLLAMCRGELFPVIARFVKENPDRKKSFHIYTNSSMLYLSRECLLNFLSNLYIPPWLEKKFQIHGFKVPRTCIESRHSYSCLASSRNSPPSSYHNSPSDKGKLLIRQSNTFSKIYFPQQQKWVEKTVICFIKI